MINQELLDYIKHNNQQGLSREQTTNALTAIGWSLSDVDEGFAAVELESTPTEHNSQGDTTQPSNTAVVVPKYDYAGFWLRVVALLIDFVFINLIVILIGLLYFWFFAKNNINVSILPTILSFAAWFAYFPYMESHTGATLGKKFVGIQVLRSSGEPVGLLRSTGRNLAKGLSAIILFIGFIMAAFTAKKQCLHDIMTDCVVVRVKKKNVLLLGAMAILSILVNLALPILIIVLGVMSLFGG